jgi:hypothetical protein
VFRVDERGEEEKEDCCKVLLKDGDDFVRDEHRNGFSGKQKKSTQKSHPSVVMWKSHKTNNKLFNFS